MRAEQRHHVAAIPQGVLGFIYIWPTGQPSPARHGPDSQRAGMARCASRAMPHRPTGLAFGPSMALWADFYAGPAHEARPESRSVPARGLLPFAFIESQFHKQITVHSFIIHTFIAHINTSSQFLTFTKSKSKTYPIQSHFHTFTESKSKCPIHSQITVYTFTDSQNQSPKPTDNRNNQNELFSAMLPH